MNNQTAITPVDRAEQALANASTPKETKQVEGMAQAAKAWAKEQNDYEMFVAAAHIYIMARRKTTELILPEITHGGNHIVTLNDYGFTKMQWHRRIKELEFTTTEIDSYFDECIAKKWELSLFGLMKYQTNEPPVKHADWCNVKLSCNCGAGK